MKIFNLDAEDALDIPLYKKFLDENGFLLIQLNYKDDEAKTMLEIVDDFGRLQKQNSDGVTLWDIKVGGGTGSESLARSHRNVDFPMHTDCSFEDTTPHYIGLYVIKQDRMGGGHNLLVEGEKIISSLSSKSLSILKNTEIKIKIPKEFYKGNDYIKAPVINGKKRV